MELLHTVKTFLDVNFLIQTFGYPGLVAIIFAETGLMLGFFLPGDSLLIAAGIFAQKGYFNITILCALLFIAASTGNIVGYYFGRHVGKRLFNRKDSLLFKKHYVVEAHKFYEEHGGKAIIIARFIPIIRTFAPIVAGIADMEIKTFISYSLVGALFWAVGLTVGGYFVGKFIPSKYFELIVLIIIVVSIAPGIYHALNTAEKRKRALAFLSSFINRP